MLKKILVYFPISSLIDISVLISRAVVYKILNISVVFINSYHLELFKEPSSHYPQNLSIISNKTVNNSHIWDLLGPTAGIFTG